MCLAGCLSLLERTVRGRGADSLYIPLLHNTRLSLLPPFAATEEISVPCLENYLQVFRHLRRCTSLASGLCGPESPCEPLCTPKFLQTGAGIPTICVLRCWQNVSGPSTRCVSECARMKDERASHRAPSAHYCPPRTLIHLRINESTSLRINKDTYESCL